MPPPDDAAALEKRALAHSLLPAWLYREQRYRPPDTPKKKGLINLGKLV